MISKDICCFICKEEFNKNGFHSHFERKHLGKQSNYKGQTGNALKALKKKNLDNLKEREAAYYKDAKHCLHCNLQIPFDKRNNKFCGHSCSASFNNKPNKNPYKKCSTRKLPELGYKKFCKISYCLVCSKLIKCKNKYIKSCSEKCKRELISNKNRGVTGGSTKSFIRYQDSFGNICSLDSLWELKTANELDKHKVRWYRPKGFLLSNGRRYTPDFYLVDFGVYLDPKAFRGGHRNVINKINMFEKEYSSICFVITNFELLNWNNIYELICSI